MGSMILDLSVIAVFALFLLFGFKNGVLKSFLSFAGAIFAAVASNYFSSVGSKFVYYSFIEPSVIKKISESMASGGLNIDKFRHALPSFVANSLETCGITPSSMNHIINNGAAKDIPKQLSALVAPIFLSVLRAIFAVVIFVCLMIVLKFVITFTAKIFKIPFVKSANSLLGGVFGCLKGYIFVAVVLCCIKSVLPSLSKTPEIFSQNNIAATSVFKPLYLNNPVYDMFQGM